MPPASIRSGTCSMVAGRCRPCQIAALISPSDFDNDGKYALLWRNPTSGATSLWLMNGFAMKGGATLPSVVGSQFVVVSPK